MGDRVFDDVARALATPMPRRAALRLAGVVALGGLTGALRPGRARAGWDDFCPAGKVLCVQSKSPPTPATCCNPGDVCCAGATWAGCCPKGTSCPDCATTCRKGTTPCGTDCCEADEVCANGVCKKRGCPPGRKKCGDDCCAKGSFCCDPDRGLCCRKGADCCNVGPPTGREKWICCPKSAKCAPMILPGQAGITGASRYVCCPKNRQVPLAAGLTICCPPGKVSLGGKLVVNSEPGGAGLCCPRPRVCGAGAAITCCSGGQVCRDGRCVAA